VEFERSKYGQQRTSPLLRREPHPSATYLKLHLQSRIFSRNPIDLRKNPEYVADYVKYFEPTKSPKASRRSGGGKEQANDD